MWETAYENQIETWAFWQTEIGQRYAEGFKTDALNKGADPAIYEHLEQIESLKLLQADPIFVEAEMENLWEAAAAEFEPEPFEASDLLCGSGFVYLPRPQYMYDVHDKTCSWRALAWLPTTSDKKGTHRGINISLYTHKDDDDDYDDIYKHPEPGSLAEQIGRYPLSLLHMDTWWFGEDFRKQLGENLAFRERMHYSKRELEFATVGFIDTWRKVQALFRLFQQKIARPVEAQMPRAARRRAERKGFEPKPVTVIRLRRPKKPRESEDEREVEWSHRWLVGAHWRNQWYPSLGVHRQVYIAPYIKGPEDKELRIREKRAFELVQ